MFVLKSTMDAAVESQRQTGAHAVYELARSYGAALDRVSALQKQLSAWVMNEPGNITPEQMAQMFWAQDDRWQAAFFNCMQDQIRAASDALPARDRSCVGVPAGESQWYWVGKHLDRSGYETLEAMLDHAKHHCAFDRAISATSPEARADG